MRVQGTPPVWLWRTTLSCLSVGTYPCAAARCSHVGDALPGDRLGTRSAVWIGWGRCLSAGPPRHPTDRRRSVWWQGYCFSVLSIPEPSRRRCLLLEPRAAWSAQQRGGGANMLLLILPSWPSLTYSYGAMFNLILAPQLIIVHISDLVPPMAGLRSLTSCHGQVELPTSTIVC